MSTRTSSAIEKEATLPVAQTKEGTRSPKVHFQSLESGIKFPQSLLNVGFGFALVLSAACLFLSAYYLRDFLISTSSGVQELINNSAKPLGPATLEVAIQARLYMARLALFSCGVFIGVSFGFLGFALFLLGIRQSVDVDAEHDSIKAKFARLSPGLLVIICATILIGVCVTRPVEFGYNIKEGSSESPNAAPTATPNFPPVESHPTP